MTRYLCTSSSYFSPLWSLSLLSPGLHVGLLGSVGSEENLRVRDHCGAPDAGWVRVQDSIAVSDWRRIPFTFSQRSTRQQNAMLDRASREKEDGPTRLA